MKLFCLALAAGAISSNALATTVTAGGGTAGFEFLATVDGVNYSPLTADGINGPAATISVGTISGTIFTQFAIDDSTPPGFGNGSPLLGKWLGNASDNSTDADSFNGADIWFRVTTTIGGNTYTGYFKDTGTIFPVNTNGLGDTISISSQNLDTISNISVGNWAIDLANSRIVLNTVPEPSAAVLGGLGLLALLRRRRD